MAYCRNISEMADEYRVLTFTQETKGWAPRTPLKVYQPWRRKLKIEPHEPPFSGIRVPQSLVFCVMVGRLLVGFVCLNL
jgi:hypothetical protein